ncbi:MAG: DUF3987 domain-containing protein, partial [Nitrospirales bacterium]
MTPAIENDFRHAITQAGIPPPPTFIFDGELHRYGDSAWYVAHGDGIPAAAFGCWRTGLSETWSAKSDRQMTAAERAAHHQRIAAISHARKAEEQRRHAEAAARAAEIWEAAAPATDDHEYLQLKQVKAYGLRVDDENDLVVPVSTKGDLSTLQFIPPDPSAKKLFLKGGAKKGGSFTIGSIGDHTVICIAEGYATAASIYMSTGYPVRVALDAGNLLPVAEATRAECPHAIIILCADNDIHADGTPNVGLLSARAAAQAVGGLVAVPEMDGEKCDLNDVHVRHGVAAVKATIEAVVLNYSKVSSTEGMVMGASSVSVLSVQSSREWLEILPVKTELLPVSPLPLAMIPAPFRGWVKDVSDRMQCPLDFIATAMIVVAGSIIGAGCGIRPKKHDDWTVVPNLWGGVVGRPSMLKTPAISEGLKPMEALESIAKQEHDAAMNGHIAELEAFKAQREALQGKMRQVANGKDKACLSMDGLKYDFANLKEPAAPIWRRYKTNDATIEKMAELQAQNPRGLLLFRDELIGLFSTWDREHHESDRSFYLESWNGVSPYTTDRIGRGTLYVENLCVSVFGGIQPSKLTGYLHGAMRGQNNDGLVQRLQVMVYPDEPATWRLMDTPVNAAARQTAYDVVKQLASMDFAQHGAYQSEVERLPYYRFDEAGQAVFYEWLSKLEGKLRVGDDEPVVLEHLGKYRSLMPSLALIFHLLSVADGKPRTCLQVSGESAEYAAAWCGYLEGHARRIYGMVTNITAQAAARLASKLSQ